MSMTFEEWLSSYGKNRYKVTEYDLKMAWEASAAETEQALTDSKAREGRLMALAENWRDSVDGSDCRCEQTDHVLSVCSSELIAAHTQGETEERSSKP